MWRKPVLTHAISVLTMNQVNSVTLVLGEEDVLINNVIDGLILIPITF